MLQVFRSNITSSMNLNVVKISSLPGTLSALNIILECNIENNNIQERKNQKTKPNKQENKKEAITKEYGIHTTFSKVVLLSSSVWTYGRAESH